MISFKVCKCGGEIFHIKQRIKGFIYFRVGAYGEETDNSELYESTLTKDYWKYYKCVDCGRIAKEVE